MTDGQVLDAAIMAMLGIAPPRPMSEIVYRAGNMDRAIALRQKLCDLLQRRSKP